MTERAEKQPLFTNERVKHGITLTAGIVIGGAMGWGLQRAGWESTGVTFLGTTLMTGGLLVHSQLTNDRLLDEQDSTLSEVTLVGRARFRMVFRYIATFAVGVGLGITGSSFLVDVKSSSLRSFEIDLPEGSAPVPENPDLTPSSLQTPSVPNNFPRA